MADFWSVSTTEPKRKFRWLLSISSEVGEIPAWIIKKVTKPTFTVSEVKHSYINHSFYYPGRVEYNEVEFTLVDPVTPDAAHNILKIIDMSGYKLPDTAAHAAQTITKESAVAALGGLTIQQIAGGDGNEDVTAIETWYLKNAWIKEVTFGDLDYESDDIVEITVKVRYDWAELGGPDAGDAAGGAGWRSTTRSTAP
tara:strand:+ start:3858 stop:4448 length:591 start_codon:yes stop_codon:yes gene_type:complete